MLCYCSSPQSIGFRDNQALLFNLDAITYQPELDLFEASLPPAFELRHPLTIVGRIGNVNNDLYQIITVENPTVSPVTFHFLGLITGGTEMIRDFKNSFSEPFRRYLPSIIELKRKQYLESAPVAAHRSSFPRR